MSTEQEPETRLSGKVSLVDMFPGFSAERLADLCVSRGLPLEELKRALRGERIDRERS